MMANVSPDFLWLAVRNTDCALLRRPNGVGDLSTCAYNPVGVQKPQYSAFANKKHASVVAHPSGEGYTLNHQARRHANKPEKCFRSVHINNMKSGDVEKFRNFVQHRLTRRDLSAAVIRKANRIAFVQKKNRTRKQAKQPSPKKN